YALGDFHARMLFHVEFRPAGRKILDKDTVAVIAESVEEFLALRFVDELARNLTHDIAISPVGVDPLDVVDELLEIELESGEPQIGFFRHALDGNIDLVDAGLEQRRDAVRTERQRGGL